MATDAEKEALFYDPDFQDSADCRAIFAFLRNLTPHFARCDRELTHAEWTAFRALAKGGAVEGIIFGQFTDSKGIKRQEYWRVKGDYINALAVQHNARLIRINVREAQGPGGTISLV
jgi:hypothetical protein